MTDPITIVAEVKSLDELKQDPENARDHNERNLGMIQTSIEANGPGRSLLIDENDQLIAGNGAQRAGLAAGIERVLIIEPPDDKTLVAVRRSNLTPDQKRAMALYDNASAEAATWNEQVIGQLALKSADTFQIVSSIWSEEDAAKFIALNQSQNDGHDSPIGDFDTDFEDVDIEPTVGEQLREKYEVELGDVWQLGEHLLVCGDCRDTRAVELAIGNMNLIDGCFTSPPYAMQRKDKYGGVPEDEYIDWFASVQMRVREYLRDTGSFFVNIKPHSRDGERALYVMDLVLAMRRSWDWRYVDELCWKRRSVPGEYKGIFKNAWEPVHHFAVDPDFTFTPRNVLEEFKSDPKQLDNHKGVAKKRKAREKKGEHREAGISNIHAISYDGKGALPDNVLEIYGSPGRDGQPGAYPWELPYFFMRAYSVPGSVWLDPFMGSGSTLIAGEKAQRPVRGIEIKPEYVAITLERWSVGTNKTPIRVS